MMKVSTWPMVSQLESYQMSSGGAMTFDIFWTLEYSRVSGASSQQGVFFCPAQTKKNGTLQPWNPVTCCRVAKLVYDWSFCMVHSHNRFLENGLWHWNLWSSGHWNYESIHFLLSDSASQRLRNHLQCYCYWIARAFSEGKETMSLFAVEESWLALPTVECIVQDQRFRCLHFPIFQAGSKVPECM